MCPWIESEASTWNPGGGADQGGHTALQGRTRKQWMLRSELTREVEGGGLP